MAARFFHSCGVTWRGVSCWGEDEFEQRPSEALQAPEEGVLIDRWVLPSD